jgi:hypothetical protein
MRCENQDRGTLQAPASARPHPLSIALWAHAHGQAHPAGSGARARQFLLEVTLWTPYARVRARGMAMSQRLEAT